MLLQEERAIVTDIAGTTRDLLRETIQIDGLPLHIIDTAGLRKDVDRVEQIGIERARTAIDQADQVILVQDVRDTTPLASLWQKLIGDQPLPQSITLVRNKIDLSQQGPAIETTNQATCIMLSAKNHQGINLLRQHLQDCVGYSTTCEGGFSARRRHLDALHRAKQQLARGAEQLISHQAGELLAEDLRQAQNSLGEITGTFTSDDLLSRIFGSFCIGK
jgi:tRNA modification GTPase